jgi:DUF971 family protein
MTPILASVENSVRDGVLALHFTDGTVARMSHARLRAACPCSQCRALRRAGQAVDAHPAVRLQALEPVGLYALNLKFDDGHERGIYPFQMLVEMGAEDVPAPLMADRLAYEAARNAI